MKRHWNVVAGAIVLASLGAAPAGAQTATQPAPAKEPSPWSADVAIGFDNSISGNINSGAVGRLNGQTVVILKNSYEDVYGTGLHFRFGGGYMLNHDTEARVTFTFQSLDADLVPLGDIGTGKLYGQYADYKSFGIDFGLRQYADLAPKIRGYGEGTLGIAFIGETDVILIAPSSNLAGNATDFYDRTAAFTLGANIGALFEVHPKVGVYGQIGLRYVTGMSPVDSLQGTGLEAINKNSSRWTIPIMAGVRVRF
jgi:opacity protein-like surface antigen